MDGYILTMVAAGALILLVAWLPMVLAKQPLSLPIICVLVGIAGFELVPIDVSTLPWTIGKVVERVCELVVLVALMGAGLKIDRRIGFRRWALTWRLLGVTMPLSIVAMTAVCVFALGMPLAGALLLAAALAPTDPVLASDVQVGPPRSGKEDDVRFALTSEAGLNDGLAFPFVNLALVFANADGSIWHWATVDVLWKIVAGLVIGFVTGKALGWVTFHVPAKARLSTTGDGFVALGVTLVVYGVTELAHGYGFLAVFVAALGLREGARDHDYHEKLHDFIEQTERLLMMVVLVLFGGALAQGMLLRLGVREVIVAAVVVFVIRPLTGWLGLIGSATTRSERALTAFFGIRGIGTLYYVAYALNHGQFGDPERLWALVGFVVLLSVLVHGVTSTPLMRWVDGSRGVTEGQ